MHIILILINYPTLSPLPFSIMKCADSPTAKPSTGHGGSHDVKNT